MSDEHAHGDAHHVNYTLIFGFLCVCTVLSIIFDLTKGYMSRPVLMTLILGVAVSKATFVLLYFMHIKFEAAWKYVLLAPTMVLACCLPFALAPDVAFHYYNVIVPQSYAVVGEHGAGSHGATHGDAGHAGPAKAHADHEHDAKKPDTHKDEAHPEPKHK